MNPEEYAAQQALISAAVARYVIQFAKFFVAPALTITQWLGLLNLLFPQVELGRQQSSDLARRFYDSQRELNHPNLPRNDRPLEGYKFEWFVKNMDEARKRMSQMDSPDDAITHLTMRATREVENAGRKQIVHAVENDPAPKIIRGWTRVATGRETCAWCLMLVSRGPTYLGADTAGLDLDDTSALAEFRDAPDIETFFANIEEHMEEWHTGCDCKVVPVFKQEGWFGEDSAKQALELWKDSTTEARRILEEDPDKKSFVNGRWIPTTLNREAINTLRRRLYKGEITTSEFAALAA